MSFKVNGRRCGGDWTRRFYEGWFSIRNRIWIQGDTLLVVAAVGLFVPMPILPKKHMRGLAAISC
jgi:hypothetical protein